MMDRQTAIDLARAYLTMNPDPGSRPGDDGLEAEAMGMAFSTGIEIITDAETWQPSPAHMYPGTTNFKLATEALEAGQVRFIGDASKLIEQAQSDKAAHDACRLIFETQLARCEAVPPELGRWVLSAKRPRKGAHKNKPRDRAIVNAVRWLAAQGIAPTRNDQSSHGESACDIVAEAMAAADRFISYDSVKQVWKNAEPWEKLTA